MQQLIKFYIHSLLKVAGSVLSAAILTRTLLMPYLESAYGKGHWPAVIASWLSSGAGVAVILASSEWLLRKKLWKWFHPELDISGFWIGINTYTHVHIGHAPVGVTSAEHEVKFKQDCLSIQIEPSEGLQFGYWESKAINLVNENKLVYAYEVHYQKDVPNRPEKAYGYEEMTILRPDGKRRPSRMKGNFYHCAAGQTPVLSGQVEFNRKKA